METVISLVFGVLGVYLVLGFCFGLFFIWRGVQQVDTDASNTSMWFRLLILPGMLVFWPLFMWKWYAVIKS